MIVDIDTCPFETIRAWKAGFSIKCPMGTSVVWTKYTTETIKKKLGYKRVLDCAKCNRKFLDWIEKVERAQKQ